MNGAGMSGTWSLDGITLTRGVVQRGPNRIIPSITFSSPTKALTEVRVVSAARGMRSILDNENLVRCSMWPTIRAGGWLVG